MSCAASGAFRRIGLVKYINYNIFIQSCRSWTHAVLWRRRSITLVHIAILNYLIDDKSNYIKYPISCMIFSIYNLVRLLFTEHPRTGSTLVQSMASRLTAPNHYPAQSWLLANTMNISYTHLNHRYSTRGPKSLIYSSSTWEKWTAVQVLYHWIEIQGHRTYSHS